MPVRTVVDSLNPNVGLQCFVGKTTDIVKLKRNRTVGFLIDVAVEPGCGAQQRRPLTVDREHQRFIRPLKRPILARAGFQRHVHLSGEVFGQRQRFNMDASVRKIEPRRCCVFPYASFRCVEGEGLEVHVNSGLYGTAKKA